MSRLADIRREYILHSLDETHIKDNPIDQFSTWWQEILRSNIDEANAMTLVTASVQARPSARIVLLKEFDDDGFVFFSNYLSRKGEEIAANPQAGLLFFWKELERQVRIEGLIEPIQAEASDAYFQSRPVGSRIGAWASPQSKPIASRKELELQVEQYCRLYPDNQIPRPPHWGGYRLRPDLVEFWQGRPSRLHDRICYTRIPDSSNWRIERLAP